NIKDGYSAAASQPGREVLHTNADVRAQALLGDRLARTEIEQVLCRDLDVFALFVDLIGLRHHGVERIERELYHSRMRHPRPVMAVVGFALLVGPHLGERVLVRLWIILHRDLRGHSTHSKNVPAVTRLDAEERI